MAEIKVIDVRDDVKRFNEYEDKIAVLEAHKELKIDGIEDKEGARLVGAARKECKKVVAAIEADRKLVKAPVLELAKAIDAKAAEFSNLAISVKTHLETEEKTIADELAKIRAKEEAEREAVINKRIDLLNSLDVTFTGLSYTIGDTQIVMLEVNEFSDEDFKARFTEMEIEDNLIKEGEAERKRLEQVESDRLAKEKAEQEIAQAKIDLQLKELADIKAEQQRKADELKAEEARIEQTKENEKQRIADAKKAEAGKREAERNAELKPYITFIRDYSKMLEMSENEYQAELIEIKKGASDHWEYERKKQIDEAKKDEAKRIHEERLEIDRKAKERKWAEIEIARLAPDKEKLLLINDSILAIELPEMKTKEGKDTIVKIQDQFLKMTVWLTSVTEKL